MMEKMVCIEAEKGVLILNHVYDIKESPSYGNMYQVYDNGKQLGGWRKDRFVGLDDIRESKLKDILDNE